MITNRLFFSIGQRCVNGCEYCFSNFEGSHLPIIQYGKIKGISRCVIYPSCDSEIFLNDILLTFFDDYIQLSSSYNIFSFSTKREYTDAELDKISTINAALISKNIGEIKISVGITNKSRINDIEPYASSYDSRLKLVGRLHDRNIKTSVIIKPILPFVSKSEYCDIIDDFAILGIKHFVTGELYIENDLPISFLSRYMDMESCHTRGKSIVWLPGHPVWQVIEETKELEKEVIKYIRDEKKLGHYNSDLDLIKALF